MGMFDWIFESYQKEGNKIEVSDLLTVIQSSVDLLTLMQISV